MSSPLFTEELTGEEADYSCYMCHTVHISIYWSIYFEKAWAHLYTSMIVQNDSVSSSVGNVHFKDGLCVRFHFVTNSLTKRLFVLSPSLH